MSKDLDSLIKKAFKMRYEDTAYPPSQEVWEKVIKRLRNQRRKDILKRFRPAIAACLLFVILSGIMLNFNSQVMAFANKFIRSIEELAGNTFIIHKSTGKSGQDNSIRMNDRFQDPRLNEAQSKVSFTLLTPEYVPNGYKLSKVDVFNENKEQESVTFVYDNSNKSEDKNDFIQIVQTCIPSGTKMSLNIKTDKDTQIKHIKIKGQEATLVKYDSSLNKVIWDIDNINYKIDGSVEEKTIVKIAESMK